MTIPYSRDFFRDILEEEPRGTFQSFLPSPFGPRRREREFFENRFSDIFNQYLGGLAGQLRRGQYPTQGFTDYLEEFPFSEYFHRASPRERGFFPGRYAPPAVWIQPFR